MARSSFLQTSFLGGEWSPFMQGRMERQDYRTAMNRCLNIIPVEEGSAPRRPGFRWLAPTRRGQPGVLRPFHFSQDNPYVMEFTAGHLRFFYRSSLVLADQGYPVAAISSADPAVITTPIASGIDQGDEVQFYLPDGVSDTNVAFLLNRVFYVNGAETTNTFPISDTTSLVGFDGSSVTLGSSGLRVAQVLDYATVYTAGQLDALRTVQDSENVLVLHNEVKPYKVTSTAATGDQAFATFSYGAATFVDGPYGDPFKDGSTVTPSALSGSITLTASIGAGTQTPAFPGFVSTDVGRMVRLLSEPLDWAAVTAYAAGAHVKFNGGYWTALKANTNKQPNLDVLNWSIDTAAAMWTWGRITAVASTVSCTVAIEPLVHDELDNIASGPLLYTHAIRTWRLGLYSDTTGWPSCGTYHEGRLWLSGAEPNRFDGGVSNDTFNFAPTGRDGTVADDNAIAYTLNSHRIQNLLWMEPDDQGILCGTQEGEWLIRASSLNDPLTPTSIQAHPPTHYGSRDVIPQRTGMALCFVHRYGRKVLEYVANPQPGKFSGTNLSLTAKHLSAPGIAEIAYQQELAPVMWGRLDDGGLIGCSYKRDDPYGTQPVAFSAWHQHTLGDERDLTSMATGPSPNGLLDSLFTISFKTLDGVDTYWVECLTTLFDEDTDITEAFFLDSASPAVAAKVVGTNVVLYGYAHLAGTSVAVWAGGLDLGDYTVAANGTVTVPYGADEDGLFTASYLATLTASGSTFAGLGVIVEHTAAGPAPDPTATTIARYADTTAALSGISGGTSCVDWDGNRAYMIRTGSGSDATNGIYKFNLATGAAISEVSVTTLGIPFVGTSPMVIDEDGAYLYFCSDASNRGVLRKVSTSTLAVVASFGTENAGFGTTAAYFAHPGSLVTIKAGDLNFIVTSSLLGYNGASANNEIAIIDTDNMEWTGFLTVLGERKAKVCRGPSFQIGDYAWGQAYALGHPFDNLGSAAALTLYAVGADNQGHYGAVAVASILPSAVVGSWTQFNNVYGLIYDETDGSVIFMCDSGADYRIVKVNPNTGLVVWSLAVTAVIPTDTCMNGSRVRHGKFAHLSGAGGASSRLYIINTATGTETHFTVTGTPAGEYLYDSETARFVFFGSYTSGGGAPTGATTASNKWWTLGPVGTTPAAANYFGPFVVGYTYTSQGQIVRPVSPQETNSSQGPGLGKTRRSHMAAALLHRSQGISWGTDFSNLRPMDFTQPDGTAYTRLELKSGIQQDTIEDDASFDSMVCWEVTRPYPATVLAIEPFLQTQDR